MKKVLCLILSMLTLLASTACSSNSRVTTSCEFPYLCDSCIASNKSANPSTTNLSPKESSNSGDELSSFPEESNTNSLETIESGKEDFSEDSNKPSTVNDKQQDLSDTFKALIVKTAKEKYLNSDWNGEPITIQGNEVSLSLTSGYLHINNSSVPIENWDLPDNWEPVKPQFTPYEFYGKGALATIPGKGTYLLEDKTLIKYFKGKKVNLTGGPLNWVGLDVNHPEEFNCTIDEYILYVPYPTEFGYEQHVLFYQPYLYYYEQADELLLITTDPISHIEYLYRFPDIESSKMELVDVILQHSVWGASYSIDTLYYLDRNLITWVWTEDGPKIDLDSGHFSDDIPRYLSKN